MTDFISAHLSTTAAHVLEVRVDGSDVVVTGAASTDALSTERFLEGDVDGSSFVSFLDEQNFRNGPVVLSVSESMGYLKYLTLPFTDESKIRETAPYELEKYLQAVPIEDTQVDTYQIGESEDGTEILAGAIKNEQLTDLIQSLSAGNQSIVSIRFALISCYRFLSLSGYLSPTEDLWLVHSDGLCASLMLIRNGRPRATRCIRFASARNQADEMDDGASTDVESAPEKGNGDSDSSDGSVFAERLQQEMERTVLSCGFDHPVTEVLFLGSSPGTIPKDEFMNVLSHTFSVRELTNEQVFGNEDRTTSRSGKRSNEATAGRADSSEEGSGGISGEEIEEPSSEHVPEREEGANVTVDMTWDVDEPISTYAACAGAAAEMAIKDADTLEFRKGSFSHQSTWESIRPYVAVFLVSLLLGSGMYLFGLHHTVTHRESVLEEYRARQNETFEELYPEEDVQSVNEPIPEALRKRLKERETNVGEEFPLNTSALEYWISLYSSIKGRGDIQLTKLIIQVESEGAGGELILEGQSSTRKLAVQLKEQIMGNPYFGQPNQARYPTQKGRVQFSMAFPILKKQ